MENTDIPQFRTYRGEIELEGVVIQVDIFVDNEMLEDRNSFLISFLCKSNTIYEMICRNISKREVNRNERFGNMALCGCSV